MSETRQAEFNFKSAKHTALFKKTYDSLSDAVYNNANILVSKMKIETVNMGKTHEFAIDSSFAGGVGSSATKALPKSNTAKYNRASISAKKVYAVTEIDRETIYTAQTSEQSFIRETKEVVRKTVEAYKRNMSRIIFGDGSGQLGTIEAGSVVTPSVLGVTLGVFTTAPASSYDVTIDASVWNAANFESNTLVNVGTGSTDCFEICEVDPSTRTLVLVRTEGATVPADNDQIFQQGSEGNDPQGLGALELAAGTSLYGIPVARRWSASIVDASAAAINVPLVNELCLEIELKTGKSPNLGITSFKQYQRLLNLHEDQKRYIVHEGSYKNKKVAEFSFSGLELVTMSGTLQIFPERFCPEDKLYLLNTDHMCIKRKPGFGWFDDDGTVFLRRDGLDCYEARYGGYWEFYINPNFHGVLTNLAV